MKDQTPEAVRQALDHLVRTASEAGVVVCGFAFGTDPAFMVNFGTCSDMGSPALYSRLCQIAEDKRQSGLAITGSVEKVN